MSSDGGGPLFGSGGFFGNAGNWGPSGPHGAWPGCGCGSLLLILGGLFIVCGGFLSMFEGVFR